MSPGLTTPSTSVLTLCGRRGLLADAGIVQMLPNVTGCAHPRGETGTGANVDTLHAVTALERGADKAMNRVEVLRGALLACAEGDLKERRLEDRGKAMRAAAWRDGSRLRRWSWFGDAGVVPHPAPRRSDARAPWIGSGWRESTTATIKEPRSNAWRQSPEELPILNHEVTVRREASSAPGGLNAFCAVGACSEDGRRLQLEPRPDAVVGWPYSAGRTNGTRGDPILRGAETGAGVEPCPCGSKLGPGCLAWWTPVGDRSVKMAS